MMNHTEKSAIAPHFWNTRHEIKNSANLLICIILHYNMYYFHFTLQETC